MADPLTKVSGYASRHMSARTLIVDECHKRLKVTWSVDSKFREFVSRKQFHNETEQNMRFNDSPRLIFDDASYIL